MFPSHDQGIKQGDLKSLQFLLDRIIGPIKTKTRAFGESTDSQGNTHWVEYIETYGVDEFSED